jgi:ATP-dependent RNA helicase DDX20
MINSGKVLCLQSCGKVFISAIRSEALASALDSQGWPASCITGAQSQTIRSSVMESFRHYRCRILVSTDLTARGIDIEKVNLVVCRSYDTYYYS